MKKYLLSSLSLFLYFHILGQQLQSPKEFLGYELGEKFTYHHKIVAYYEHVADVMPNVKVQQYGVTNEGRPLIVAFISSQENFDKLEEIRQDNLRRAGLMDGAPSGDKVSIVWLSYNVHGNESVSSEATMLTLYALANDQDKQSWLENTVVVLDPCINPDGRDRYAVFYNQYGNVIPNPNLDSKEHREPWPGGRTNHYMFDLNRDWAWQTQIESKQRMKLYNDWLPHVHVDFHEQFINNPYYFAPAARPFHEVITGWQKEFQTMIGKNHAKYFDENNWLYFTKEVFDLFYPSYGDTYPTYNGAIGMTYEKGGGGFAGLAGMMNNGDTVTLRDRIIHHYTTGISTVEITSQHAERVVDEFEKYFTDSRNNPTGQYKTYMISSDNHPDKLERLTSWLDDQDIEYGYVSTNRTYNGFNYRTGRNSSFSVSNNDIVISVYQPKSRLVKVLFEPESNLEDSLTYDITAWAIPYNYDLRAYATSDRLNPLPAAKEKTFLPLQVEDPPYAYLAKYESLKDLQFMSNIMKRGIKVRVAEQSFSLDNNFYPAGTLVILRWDNEDIGETFDKTVLDASRDFSKEIFAANTGFVESGKDFGSGYVNFIKTPKVAVLSGEQVSPYSFGEIWYFFEQVIEYPVTILDTDYLERIDLKEYDVFIVPSGFYRLFNDDYLKMLNEWVRHGGRLILVENAINAFVDKEGFGISEYFNEEEKSKDAETTTEEEALKKYEGRQRRNIPESIPGAIFKAQLDNSHPLGFGFPGHYFTIRRGDGRFAYLKDGWNVAVIRHRNDLVSGFAGSEALENVDRSLVFGVENKGSGEVVYLVDNPLFRAFWYSGNLLFGNAVFMVGQ